MNPARQSAVSAAAGACFLALGVLLWTGYSTAQRLLDWGPGGREASNVERSADSKTSEIRYDVSHVVDAHLFGEKKEERPVEVVDAPETKLRINLQGLIASSDERFARAIVNVDGSRTRPYSVGQSIEGTDAAVHAVQKERVLLKRGEALESLALRRESLNADSAGSTAGSTTDNGSRRTNAVEPPSFENRATDEFRSRLEKKQLKLPF